MKFNALWLKKQTITVREIKSKHLVKNPHSHIDIEHIDVAHFKLPTGAVAKNSEIRAAVYDIMSVGCCCEHDCCGCWFGGVQSYRKQGRNITVVTRYQRNY